MTALSVDGTRDPWQVRLAIAAHPSWWQERYGDEAAATLADLTSARGAVPRADVMGLFLRGILLRGRSSMIFWLGATLIGMEILATSTNFEGFRTDRAWGSILAHAGWAVMAAIPLVAGSAAWAAGHQASPSSVRSRLAGLGRSAAAVLGFAALGYLTIVVLVVVTSGWPLASSFDLGYTAGFAAMTLSAFGLGTLLGSALPRWLALPAGIALGLLAMISDGWQNGELRWRNVTGSALTFDADWGVPGTANLHITVVTAAYAAVFLTAAIVAVILRRRPLRLIALVVTLSLVIVGSVTISKPLLHYVGSRGSDFRGLSELHCAGSAPRICLWPEQDATVGTQMRTELSDLYRRSAALGIPVATTISSGVVDHPESVAAIWVSSSTRPDRFSVTNFAEAVINQGSCLDQPERISPDDQSAATLGLSLLLGATSDADIARTTGITTIDPVTGKPHHDTAAEIRDYYGIHTKAEAKAAVSKWFAERTTCVGSRS